jgi:hypothetical protein
MSAANLCTDVPVDQCGFDLQCRACGGGGLGRSGVNLGISPFFQQANPIVARKNDLHSYCCTRTYLVLSNLFVLTRYSATWKELH